MNRADNPYLDEALESLPRLLGLFDDDPFSRTRGVGDRRYWGWKLADFANGTFQGAAHGLARLRKAGVLPPWLPPEAALRRIDAMFQGAAAVTRKDGSLEEAFPHEASFCVTALAAFDLISAVRCVEDPSRRNVWLAAVRPLIAFLHRADESHGKISNHVAAAAAALFAWTDLTGEPGRERGKMFLDRITGWASDEGWFPEYGGADPGYQTFCLYYLADLHRTHPELGLAPVLSRAVEFLGYFAHPDGSFGGCYGSRGTRFYCPGGAEILGGEMPAALALSRQMRRSVAERRTVVLSAVDEPNLVPFFNAYCRAAVEPVSDVRATTPVLPALSVGPWRRVFKGAGLVVDRGTAHYTVVSFHKGGALAHFQEGGRAVIDAGAAAEDARGRLWSAQSQRPANEMRLEGDVLTVISPMTRLERMLPTPVKFLALRAMNLTVMRIGFLRDAVKSLLVRFLIGARRGGAAWNRRTIRLGKDISVEDLWAAGGDGFRRRTADRPFSAIHMASQGYWQKGDDDPAV